MYKSFCLGLLSLFTLGVQAQEASIRLNRIRFGGGGVVLRDEYLSPLNYAGFVVNYSDENVRLSKHHRLAESSLLVSLGQTKNPAQNGSISILHSRLSGSRLFPLYRGRLGILYFGPGYTIGLGGLYSNRNGNNPATFKMDAHLSLSMSYGYRLNWDKCPILLQLSSRTDLLGTRWSQGFGESYYEMYYLSKALGKRFHLSHLGNGIGQELKFSLDIPIYKKITINLNYGYTFYSSNINELNSIQSLHTLGLGLTSYTSVLGGKKWVQSNKQLLPF